MTFFQGHDIYTLDSKGRVNIPAKMRKAMSPEAEDTFTLTRGYRKCISAYPKDEWEKVQSKLRAKNQWDDDNDYVITTMLMWCSDTTLDVQQRITIPKKLLDFAGIEGKVLILGKIDHIELWNPDEFENMLSGKKVPYEEVASKVMRNSDNN